MVDAGQEGKASSSAPQPGTQRCCLNGAMTSVMATLGAKQLGQ